MGRATAVISAEELFGQYSNQDFLQNSEDGFETYWAFPEEIANGFMTIITPRPGIFLEIGNYRLHENIAVSTEGSPCAVIFGFSVLGSLKYALDSENGKDEYWCYKQGHSVMGYLPKHRQSTFKSSLGPQAFYVIIAIDPLLLKNLVDEQNDQMPYGLRDILEGAGDQPFCRISAMPPAGSTAIQQIVTCPYQSSLKRLFLESKVLELISLSLAQLVASAGGMRRDDVELRPDDIEHVLEARDILIGNLEKPPSLFTLAKQVGTNKTTLNKGFRQIFGTSTFEYLRIQRLERARELLASREMNVSEVAIHVGYSHQTSFTRAFKNYFGIYPTDHFR
jgi:AraC-like DNA-binding protein